MDIKAAGGFTKSKPTPLGDADLRVCAEAAQCGPVTELVGRVIAYLKQLHGCRNTVFPEWKWKDIHFVQSRFYQKSTESEEVCVRTCV